jgi:hypothetical protein
VEIAFMNLRQLAHDLIQENKDLRSQNGQLREKLAAANIPVEFSSPAHSSYGGGGGSGGGGPSSGFGASPRSMGGYTSSGAGQSQASSMPISHPSPPFPQAASPPNMGAQHQQQQGANPIDLENIAMEFVGTYGRTPYLSPPPNL